ncbi:MAG: nucleotide-diphospho-sugar transferase [Ferruginibacter sp.]|nr:nucleotide-diphospho-sugar transferase [Ferruginibacter sp.]
MPIFQSRSGKLKWTKSLVKPHDLKAAYTYQNLFKTPILFLIFNRPETTKLVFEQIKKVQPKFLYVAADGPRNDREGDAGKCIAARAMVMDFIDWPCEVKTLFRTENAGCKKAVSEAINWFFEDIEMGIILEDDCLPSPSFFAFCAEALGKYRDDDNVLAINGCNFNYKPKDSNSYFFSRYINAWGWATWKRSAVSTDYEMISWQKKSKLFFIWKHIKNNLFDFDLDWCRYWRINFDAVASKALDTWDYQWQYQLWNSDKIMIVSSHNLVVNIGFGADATHTSLQDHKAAALTAESVQLPLKHPMSKAINKEYEEAAIKPVWHLYHRKSNLFYLLNYINTRSFIKTLRPGYKKLW